MINKIFYNLSVTLFGILTFTFLISSVGFIFHIPVNIFDLLIPFVLGVFYLFKNSDTKKEFFIQLLMLFVLIAVSYYISLTFWDDTWDGRSYHAATIIMLKNGWLPLYDNISEITQKLSLYPFNTQFSDCYLKFSEIVGANIYNLTGNIESPKTTNLLFVSSLFMYSFSVIKGILKKNTISIILAVCICLNLPCVYQLLTNYVDIQIYIAFTFFILTVLKTEKTGIQTKTDTFILIMSSVMLATVKLTGIAYCGVIYLSWIIYKIIRKKEVKGIMAISAVSTLIVLITSINPFYTNLKKYGHPFHPFMGINKMILTPKQYPAGFPNKTPLQRFLISTFSESTNSIENHVRTSLNQPVYWKIPFTRIYDAPLSKFEYPDMRIGGFGYYWSGILCLTILMLVFMRFNTKENKNLYLFLTTTVLMSVAINPDAWWARYVPQFWLFPIVTLLSVFSNSNSKFYEISKIISVICIFFILYNSVEPIKYHLKIKYDFANYHKSLFKSLENDSKFIYFMQNKNYNTDCADEALKMHLKEYNINIREQEFDLNRIEKEEFLSFQTFNPVFEEYYFYKPVYKKDNINDK